MSTPTEQAYSELQHAYDVFNTRLFAGQLPPCPITMQRKNRTYGYCSGERWNDQAGAPGGTHTGQHMSHDVVAGGPFAQACTDLLTEGLVISWQDRVRVQVPGKGKAGVRSKYTCPDCGRNAWVKADVVLRCGACEVALEPEAPEGQHTPDTDAPLARLVGHFTNTGRTPLSRVCSAAPERAQAAWHVAARCQLVARRCSLSSGRNMPFFPVVGAA